MRTLLLLALVLFVAGPASSQDTKADGPIALKLVAKTDTYKFDAGGATPQAFKAKLEELAKKLQKGEPAMPPKALAVDLVLQLTNTSDKEQTIHVGGDTNVFTFELTGGTGVVTMPNPVAFTADFRLPKAVTVAPGKSHEIPVKVLADGQRGFSRLLFWTGPGEYQLAAKYTLATQDGGKGPELKSAPAKVTVTEK